MWDARVKMVFFSKRSSIERLTKNASLIFTFFKLYAGVYLLVPAFFLVNIFVNSLYMEISANFWETLFGTDWGNEFFAPVIQCATIGFIVLLKFKLYRRATSFTLRLFTH